MLKRTKAFIALFYVGLYSFTFMVKERYTNGLISWRMQEMKGLIAFFWLSVYVGLIVLGGMAGAGWAIVGALAVMYVVGLYFKKEITEGRGRCRGKEK